jgi:hypothetical protein
MVLCLLVALVSPEAMAQNAGGNTGGADSVRTSLPPAARSPHAEDPELLTDPDALIPGAEYEQEDASGDAEDVLQEGRNPSDQSVEVFRASRRKQDKESPDGIVLNKEFSVGGKATTAGWSFFGEYARVRSRSRKQVFQIEFMELKHPKQVKVSNDPGFFSPGIEAPRAFVFGKQNNLYAIHFGYGQRYMLGDKAKKSGVEVNLTWTAGPTLGLLKPYYVRAYRQINDQQVIIEEIKYTEEDATRFLTPTSIYGAAGFSFGLGEIRPIPGAFGKVGLNFDWANYSEFIKSLEAGIGADLFFERTPIMVSEQNKVQFVYLYLSLQLGKKW